MLCSGSVKLAYVRGCRRFKDSEFQVKIKKKEGAWQECRGGLSEMEDY